MKRVVRTFERLFSDDLPSMLAVFIYNDREEVISGRWLVIMHSDGELSAQKMGNHTMGNEG